MGIDKLKAAVLLVVAFVNQGKDAFADGFQTMDLFKFLDEAMQVGEVAKTAKEVLAEIKDMDAAERAELVAAVKEALQETKEVESVVEHAINSIGELYLLYTSIQLLKAA
jgi:chaperonin GroEL (HSP60 family)